MDEERRQATIPSAVFHCSECDQDMCEYCCKQHGKFKVTESHVVTKVNNIIIISAGASIAKNFVKTLFARCVQLRASTQVLYPPEPEVHNIIILLLQILYMHSKISQGMVLAMRVYNVHILKTMLVEHIINHIIISSSLSQLCHRSEQFSLQMPLKHGQTESREAKFYRKRVPGTRTRNGESPWTDSLGAAGRDQEFTCGCRAQPRPSRQC